LAEEASRQEPDAQPGVLLLGVARYRAGQYEEALAPLTHAAGRGDETAHVFQAMAWYRLGRLAEAQAALSAVRARNLDDVRAQDAELQGFLNEAQELIGRGTNDSG
jgi:Flp pilus assembly protein TadD